MKLWLFYANVGGGHKNAATAIAEEFSSSYHANVETVLVNATEGSLPFTKTLVEGGYSFLINKAYFLWKILYQISKLKTIMRLENALFSFGTKKMLVEKLKTDRPDKIVAMYFMVGAILSAIEELNLDIPVIVLVTDPFTAHPIWFYYKKLSYVVFSGGLKHYAVNTLGVPEANIKVLPTIINKKFLADPNEYDITALKKARHLKENKKTILIAGGGEGLPYGSKILKELLDSGLDAQYMVATGRDKNFKNEAEKIAKKSGNCLVYGFVDFMNELIAISDLVITKGGPASVMEALSLRKPLVLSHYIWEQEKGNVEFVLDNGLGYFEKDIKKIPALCGNLLFDKTEIENFNKKLDKLSIKSGTGEIASYIQQLV